MILNGPILKSPLDQNHAIFASWKAINKQFQREREVTKWLDLVSKYMHENEYTIMNYWLTLTFIII